MRLKQNIFGLTLVAVVALAPAAASAGDSTRNEVLFGGGAALATLDAGGGIADDVTVVGTPASCRVRNALASDGTLAALENHGAVISETGCGPCCGTSGPVPPGNDTSIVRGAIPVSVSSRRSSAAVFPIRRSAG